MARRLVEGSVLALVAALVACDGAGDAAIPSVPRAAAPAPRDGGEPDAAVAPPPGEQALSLRFDDGFVRAARVRPGGGLVVVLERPVHLGERYGRPDRRLVLLDPRGAAVAAVEATAGRELLDVAVHPSGEATVLEASREGYHLVRLDAAGARAREAPLVDDDIWTDPPSMHAGESRSRIEEHTHDTGRLAVEGEGVVLATRTGRHSVVAYRVAYEAPRGFVVAARTLTVPAHPIAPVGLQGGSYDTFGQLDAHYAVHVARDASGLAYVGVQHARVNPRPALRAIEAVFGEALATDEEGRDALVTRLAPDGERLGISVVGTPDDDQLYGLRADDDGVLALGRSERWNAQGTGFDALIARVDRQGAVELQRFDVELGDVAFDAAVTARGLLVVGSRGYAQNPHGASISERASTFASLRGEPSALLALPDGPRHSQARVVLPLDGRRALVGGMLDGPGTHSADGDRASLRARGFLETVALP